LTLSSGTYGSTAKELNVRVGSKDLEAGGEVIAVLTVIVHPNFNFITPDYDYAMLKLTRLIALDGITKAVIRLPLLYLCARHRLGRDPKGP
jgi:Trypsin